MDESIKPTNAMNCPLCGTRMELLSQQGGFVSAGCKPCSFSRSFPSDTWKAAKAERDAISNALPPPE